MAPHISWHGGGATTLPSSGARQSRALKGMDSLLSIVQMPAGIPVGTLAIGAAGATNAALLAIAILATHRPELREQLHQFRAEQTQRILGDTLP